MRLITRDHAKFRDPLCADFSFTIILHSKLFTGLFCGESSIEELFDVCFNTVAEEGRGEDYVAWRVHRA